MALFRLLAFFLLATVAASAQPKRLPTVDYHVGFKNPRSEKFQVSATLGNITSDTLLFHFPIWAPGAYELVYFGRFVEDMRATSATGKSLVVIRRDPSTFAIVGVAPGTRLDYRVRDIESLPNALWFCLSDIEPTLAYAVGSALFGYPAGYKDVPYSLEIDIPNGWDLAIPLDESPEKKGRFIASDYDELVDAPLQAGRLRNLDFVAGGKPHRIAIWSPRPLADSVTADMIETTRRVVNIISGFFGEMPYDRYIFQMFLVDAKPSESIYGALEHRNSSTYRWPIARGIPSYGLTSIIAHEYWHVWSPKRVHVSQLGPFDYQQPPRTNSLWFAEGLTEYYANMLLMRNGMYSPNAIHEDLELAVRSMHGRPQPISLGAVSIGWCDLGINTTMKLYTTGPIIGLLLDAAIRSQTDNRRSLDDAMRAINEEYGKTGKTFEDEDLIPMIERATGASLEEFNRRYILGVDPLPFDRYLPVMGLRVDNGEPRNSFGAEFVRIDPIGWRVASIQPRGTLAGLGLKVGDTVTGLETDGEPIQIGRLDIGFAIRFPQLSPGSPVTVIRDGWMREVRVGTRHTITFLRDGKSRTVPLVFRRSFGSFGALSEDPEATPQALAIRRVLIGK
jgi:predicted metalloprotease with PDZ domain